MLLTAERLLHYQRCHRRTFLDVYGDRSQKDPYTDFQLKLRQQRLAHQQLILEEQIRQGATPPHQPNYPPGDWQAGALATTALMQQGVERIYQGVLMECAAPNSKSLDEFTLVSHPDLLVKQPGKSYFGDWIYAPIDIHLGKRPKQEYQIVAAYHTQLLASVQGAWSENAWLMLRGKTAPYGVDLWRWLPEMQASLDKCMQMLLHQQEPEVFISRQQCSVCPWLSQCYARAKSQQHISLIPGVTPTRYQHLQTLGLTTLESLADANPLYLEPELAEEVAQHLVQQAQSVKYNRVIMTNSASSTSVSDLATAPVELYFDIEAEPELTLDYLLGVLVVDRQAQTEKFYPFLAEKPEDEELIWQQFLDLVKAYPNAPIFHFSPYEADTVKRLAKLYQTPGAQVQQILSRFVDIHKRVTGLVTLPVEGYSLKAIANWIGFKWRDPEANGSQAIYWYDEWLETGDRALLDIIVRYNEDDCRATRHVKDWLVDNLPN
ncbi:MAG TPA: TM0106 family RecB-like putative nuclease [Candidatus Obscuribacterales bacterium]